MTLRHFDEAIFDRLACERVPVTRKDGKEYQFFCVSLPGLVGNKMFRGMIPVVYDSPEDVEAEYRLPCFAVVPSGMEAATNRMNGVRSIVSRLPAEGALAKTITRRDGVTASGWTAYEETPAPDPYDLSYEVKCRARKRGEQREMLQYLLKCFPKNLGIVYAKDSNGVEDSYTAHHEGVADSSEVTDVTERMFEASVSIRVEAEIDLLAQAEYPAVFAGVTLNFGVLEED